MLQEYDKYPNWLIDVEEGKIWSKTRKKYIDSMSNKGYYVINVLHERQYCVHRIIWECANGQIPEGYDVHHINENKLDNRITNLELIEHSKHKIKHQLGKKSKLRGKQNTKTSKPCIQINKETNEIINEYPSVMEVERILGYKFSCICRCCRGERKTAYGFKWKYKDETEFQN